MNTLHPKGLCWRSRKNKLCFIGVPKNAQTSIRKMFGFHEHSVCRGNYYDLIKTPGWAKKFTLFCVMRNPYDRLASAYLEILKRAYREEKSSDDDLIHQKTREMPFYHMKESENRFVEFLNQVEKEFWDEHIQPQAFYILDHSGQLLPFDYILSFENLEEDMRHMCSRHARIRHHQDRLPHLNSKSTIDKNKIMGYINNNPTIKSKIYEIYKQDFELYKQLIGEYIE